MPSNLTDLRRVNRVLVSRSLRGKCVIVCNHNRARVQMDTCRTLSRDTAGQGGLGRTMMIILIDTATSSLEFRYAISHLSAPPPSSCTVCRKMIYT